MASITSIARALIGERIALPPTILDEYPELGALRYRRGGLPLRLGGWALGRATVAAITLGRTIFIASSTRLDPELLLHEFRHVQQFSQRRTFPLHYIWESMRRGYYSNRYETDARDYAARRVASAPGTTSAEDQKW